MNDDVKRALGPLNDRAEMESGSCDRISLRDFIVSVEIGAFQIERDVTQRLKFNIVVDVPPMDPALNDDVDKILSYDTLIEGIQTELNVERLNLLETLAERIASRILEHPFAKRIYLRIEKLDRGIGDLGVEIMREQAEGVVVPDAQTRPSVVYLSPETIGSTYLSAWMDVFSALDGPVVICVGISQSDEFDAAPEKVQAHMRVLDIDKTAWYVSAFCKDCLVVGSRTELIWAIGQNRLCVWAPYKMAFDAVPAPETLSGLGLAQWVYQMVDGRSFDVIGAPTHGALDADFYCPTKPDLYR